MKILHLDKNHNSLIRDLKKKGYINVEAYKMSLEEIKSVINEFDGVVIRSRFKIDPDFLKNGKKIIENGRIVKTVKCSTIAVDTNYDKRIHKKLQKWFDKNYNIKLDTFNVDSEFFYPNTFISLKPN